MKFLVPSYSCLQNPWQVGYHPQIPVLSVLSSTEFVEPPPNKIPGYATACNCINVSDLHLPWSHCMIQCQRQRHSGVKLKFAEDLEAKWDSISWWENCILPTHTLEPLLKITNPFCVWPFSNLRPFVWGLRSASTHAHYRFEACPESKDTKVLNTYNIFNLQKRHCEWIACT